MVLRLVFYSILIADNVALEIVHFCSNDLPSVLTCILVRGTGGILSCSCSGHIGGVVCLLANNSMLRGVKKEADSAKSF